MISAICWKPMLIREPVLLVSFCQAVLRISPETMPHRISLVVGTNRLDRRSTAVAPVTVVVVSEVEPEPSVPPVAAPVVVPVVVVVPEVESPAAMLVTRLFRSE